MSTIYGNPLLLGGGGGVKLNIDYGTNPPSDTTKLWVPRVTAPSSVEAKYEFKFGNEQLAVSDTNFIPHSNSTAGSMRGIPVGNYIYIFSSSSGSYSGFQRYNMTKNEWDTTFTSAVYPKNALNFVSIAAVDNKIYCLGGYNSSSNAANYVYEYDIAQNTFTAKTNSPINLSAGCWIKYGDVLYGFGTYYGSYNRVVKYDYTTNTFTDVSGDFSFDSGNTLYGSNIYYYPFDAGNGIYYLLPTHYNRINGTELIKVDMANKSVTKDISISTLCPTINYPLSTSGTSTYKEFCFAEAGVVQVGSTGYIIGGRAASNSRDVPFIWKVNISSEGLTATVLDKYLFDPTKSINLAQRRAAACLDNEIHIVEYYYTGSDTSYRNNQTLTLYSPLENNKLFLQTGFGNNKFNIVNDNKAKVEIAINNAFIGNSENKADETDAFLYSTNDSKWKNIKDGNEWYLKPTVSTTATSGVTYVSGLSGLAVTDITRFAEAISNNSSITNATSTIYVDFDSVHRKVSIGDKIALALNGTNYTFDVIGFNHDTLTDANAYGAATKTGKAGITFQMHDLFATYYPMNSSNANSGGWKSSAMRTSTMPLMKGYMPAAWQSAIKIVDKKSGVGGGSSSGTDTTSDDLFLLAEIEIFGSTTYSVSGEGTQYAYYKAGSSKVKNMGGSASHWFERSPYSGNEHNFCMVGKDGTAARSNTTLYPGIAFAFCV